MNEKERWEKAIEYAREMLSEYRSIGPAGIFGCCFISESIRRYEDGERSQELLEELESIE